MDSTTFNLLKMLATNELKVDHKTIVFIDLNNVITLNFWIIINFRKMRKEHFEQI